VAAEIAEMGKISVDETGSETSWKR